MFHRLYDLSFNKDIKVDSLVRSFGSCLGFRRTLWGDLAGEWFDLLNIIHNVVLREGEDRVTWKLGNKGFIVKSLYNVLHVRQPVKVFKDLWKMKLPGKIKIFLWVVIWGKTLTKVNLGRRGWGISSVHVLFS
jgi:hypothetical protein